MSVRRRNWTRNTGGVRSPTRVRICVCATPLQKLKTLGHARWDVARLLTSQLARDIIKALRGRQLTFFGDSVTSQHFTELVCIIVESTTTEFSIASRDCKGLWGSSICVRFHGKRNLAGSTICYTRFDKQVEGDPTPSTVSAAFARTAMTSADIAIMNIGIHHEPEAAGDETRVLSRAVAALHAANPEAVPTILWRETATQHFIGGKWNKNSRVQMTQKACLCTVEESMDWYNRITNPIATAAGWPILKIWNATKDKGHFHRSDPKKDNSDPHKRLDCSHWCQGGVIHMHFNPPLLDALRSIPILPRDQQHPRPFCGWDNHIGGLSAHHAQARWGNRSVIYPWQKNPKCLHGTKKRHVQNPQGAVIRTRHCKA